MMKLYTSTGIFDCKNLRLAFLIVCCLGIFEVTYYFHLFDNIGSLKIEEVGQIFDDPHHRVDLVALNAKLEQKLHEATNRKIILLWTTNNDEAFETNTDIKNCGFCELTNDQKKISDPDTAAIVMRHQDIIDIKFPQQRRIDQYYVWFNQESSSTMYEYRDTLKKVDDMFNLTMSYRQDADIWTPYGSAVLAVQLIPKEKRNAQHVDEIVKKKRRLALWLVSNCGFTPGAVLRMKYAKSLKEDGLDVDFRGLCFSKTKMTEDFSDYKFLFAFENSFHCKDYITEKFFVNALLKGIVPVVFGTLKKDYLAVAPPKSFIYAKDYTNQELISLLNYLDRNDAAYKEYLQWRTIPLEEYKENRRARAHCQLCRLIHGIDYDYVFNPKYNESVDLFPGVMPHRHTKSLTNWTFLAENKDCMNKVFHKLQMHRYDFFLIRIVVIVSIGSACLLFFCCARRKLLWF